MGVAVALGAAAAWRAVGAAVVDVDAGMVVDIGVDADTAESRRALGGLTQEREVGYGNAHVVSLRPHT